MINKRHQKIKKVKELSSELFNQVDDLLKDLCTHPEMKHEEPSYSQDG